MGVRNSMKARLRLFPVLFLMVILLVGCGVNTSQTTTPETSTQQPNSPSSTPTPPIEIEVAFPDGAPPLNQTAELTCTIITRNLPMKDIDLEIILPDGLELVRGQLSWNGELPRDSVINAINAEVKSVKLGNWTIEIPYHINPIEPGGYGGDGKRKVYISIMEDSAEWSARNPPWQRGTPTVDTSDLPPRPQLRRRELQMIRRCQHL
jgi:hypothetical protein